MKPMTGAETIRELSAKFGGRFSTALGVDLPSGRAEEIYKWFLASILFGARISQNVAANTYREFERAGVLSPQAVMQTGWDGLVQILDRGGYVRYDYKTATKLLEVNQALLDQYGGNLNALHERAEDEADLEQRLKALGRGIGEVTVNIFLREMRGIWRKAQPQPSDLVVAAAIKLEIIPPRFRDKRKILELLQQGWAAAGMPPGRFADFEAALVRAGILLRRKRHGR